MTIASRTLISVVILTIGGSSVLISRLSAGPPSQGTGKSAPAAQITERILGTHLQRMSDQLVVEVNASLLVPVPTREGSAYRSVWMNAIATRNGVTVGETRYHALVDVSSREAVDLSIPDINAEDGDVAAKGFEVLITPASGKTWGQVMKFKEDAGVGIRLKD